MSLLEIVYYKQSGGAGGGRQRRREKKRDCLCSPCGSLPGYLHYPLLRSAHSQPANKCIIPVCFNPNRAVLIQTQPFYIASTKDLNRIYE